MGPYAQWNTWLHFFDAFRGNNSSGLDRTIFLVEIVRLPLPFFLVNPPFVANEIAKDALTPGHSQPNDRPRTRLSFAPRIAGILVLGDNGDRGAIGIICQCQRKHEEKEYGEMDSWVSNTTGWYAYLFDLFFKFRS